MIKDLIQDAPFAEARDINFGYLVMQPLEVTSPHEKCRVTGTRAQSLSFSPKRRRYHGHEA